MKSIKTLFKSVCLIFLFISSQAFSDIVNEIKITGNDRISDETIKLFISVNTQEKISDVKLNNIINDLYETNFFKNISVKFEDQILLINVIENPIIENILYKGIKSKRILEIIKQETAIKQRSSYNESLIKKDKLKIKNILKNLGYYNVNLDILIEQSKNNLVSITYDVDLGKKSKIKKITFIGNKFLKIENYEELLQALNTNFGNLSQVENF